MDDNRRLFRLWKLRKLDGLLGEMLADAGKALKETRARNSKSARSPSVGKTLKLLVAVDEQVRLQAIREFQASTVVDYRMRVMKGLVAALLRGAADQNAIESTLVELGSTAAPYLRCGWLQLECSGRPIDRSATDRLANAMLAVGLKLAPGERLPLVMTLTEMAFRTAEPPGGRAWDALQILRGNDPTADDNIS